MAVALAACGPRIDGGDDEHGAEGETDPSATASGSASASATESSSGSASATSLDTSSASGSTASDVSTDDATATATLTFTEDGPAPPEGGEIGEGGDCWCCGSSLHVVTSNSDAIGFALTMSSPSFSEFVVTCPDATIAGLDDVDVGCGQGEVTLASDGIAHEFGEETWTVRFEDLLPTDQQPAECEYGPSCDCNCQPSSCELVVHEPNDG